MRNIEFDTEDHFFDLYIRQKSILDKHLIEILSIIIS
jgi:hypothetical protein